MEVVYQMYHGKQWIRITRYNIRKGITCGLGISLGLNGDWFLEADVVLEESTLIQR